MEVGLAVRMRDCLQTVRAELVEAWARSLARSSVPRACAEGGSRDVAPAGDSLFFASPKKSKQKKGDPQSATPALRYGANLRRGGCGVRRRTHCALSALRSDNRGESDHEARALRRPCHPATAPPQAQPAGGWNSQTATRAIAALGPPAQRVALAPASWGRAQRSEAMARVDVRSPGSLLYAPGARRARGGMRVGARMLRELTHRSCLSGARQRAASSAVHPATEHPRLPRSAAKGSQTAGSPFLWSLSFGDPKERDSPAGATSRPPPSA